MLLFCCANGISAKDYYCCADKAGIDSKYTYTLQQLLANGRQLVSGDRILLSSGNYGKISITGAMPGYVTIMPEEGEKPVFTSLYFNGASKWRIQDINVTGVNSTACVSIDSNSSSIQLTGCNVGDMSVSDSWTTEQWSLVPDGIVVQGARTVLLHNHIYNVRKGIVCNAERIMASYNVVDNFTSNGIEITGSFNTLEYNLVRNAINLHKENNSGVLFQGADEIKNVTLRGNSIYNYTNYKRRYLGPMAGIVSFGPKLNNIRVESNLVVCDHWHGLSLFNLTNGFVVNNTVVDTYLGTVYNEEPRKELRGPIGPCRLWIEDKTGNPTGNIISNNLVTGLRIEGNHKYEGNNMVVNSNYSSFDATFVDWSHLDFRLKPKTMYIHAGLGALAPDKDNAGYEINKNTFVNLGAFQNTGEENRLDSLTIYCDERDVEIRSNGKNEWNGQPSLKIGAASDRYSSNAFFPFVLPSIPPSSRISSAQFGFNLEQIQNSPTGSVDLYALMPQKAEELGFDDFYAGDYRNAKMARLIQPIIMNSSTPAGYVSTSYDGSVALADYITALMQSGVRPGDTFILRLNHSDNNMKAYSRWIVSSANNKSMRPFLRMTFDNSQSGTGEGSKRLHIYPLPSHRGIVSFTSEGFQSGGMTLRVSDSKGKEVFLKAINNKYVLSEDEALSRGNYTVQLFDVNGMPVYMSSFYVW